MQGWKGEAEAIVNDLGIDRAHTEYFTNKELKPAVRNALGLALIDAYGQTSEFDKVNALASDMIETATELGRAVKALDLANRYDPKSWSFIAEKLKSRTKQPLTQEEYARGKQAVERYSDAADDVDLSRAFELENRSKAEKIDEAVNGLSEAIKAGETTEPNRKIDDRDAELESLKKEVARLTAELEKKRKPRKPAKTRVNTLLDEF